MTLFLLQTNKNQRCKYIAICLLVQFLFLGIQKMVNNWNENRFEICKLEITTTTKSLQSCPTLCDPADGSPPGSTIPGSLQARTLEWVSISFSNAWKWNVKVKSLSRVRLFETPWTAAYQAPLSMGFSRQEYWSGLLLPSLELEISDIKLKTSWLSTKRAKLPLQLPLPLKGKSNYRCIFPGSI